MFFCFFDKFLKFYGIGIVKKFLKFEMAAIDREQILHNNKTVIINFLKGRLQIRFLIRFRLEVLFGDAL